MFFLQEIRLKKVKIFILLNRGIRIYAINFFNTNKFLRYTFCSLSLHRFSLRRTQEVKTPVIKSCARLVQPSSNYRKKFLEPPFKIILTSTLKKVTK
jgi:hypothetical protein